MRLLRIAFVALVVTLVVLGCGTPAGAGTGKGSGHVGDGRITTWIQVHADGSFTAPEGFHLRYSFEGPDESCEVEEGRWREWLFYGDDPARGHLSGGDIVVLVPGGDGIGLVGGAFGLELINPGPNHGDVTRPFCGPPPVADLDIWESASRDLPDPNLSLSPSPEVGGYPTGITGMEIWLWFDPGLPGWNPPEVTASVSVDAAGLTAQVDAWIAAVEWRFDNGESRAITFVEPGQTAPPPAAHYRELAGQEDKPARTYTYESKGMYSLAIDVIWTGWFELYDAAGASLGSYPLGPYTDTQAIDYQVIEVRAVIAR